MKVTSKQKKIKKTKSSDAEPQKALQVEFEQANPIAHDESNSAIKILSQNDIETQIELGSLGEWYLARPCELLIESGTGDIFINEIRIDSKFYNLWLAVASFQNFPSISLKSSNGSNFKVKLRSCAKSSRLFVVPSSDKSISIKDTLLKEVQSAFVDLDKYQQIAKRVMEKVLTDPSRLMNNVLICGEKNMGKSSLSNFIMNYALNLTQPLSVNYIELDLGKPSLSIQGHVSVLRPTVPTFVNAPNSIAIVHPDETIYQHCIGENSPHYNFKNYLGAIKEVFIQLSDLSIGQKNRHLNVINLHGYVKGFGKLLKFKTMEAIAGITYQLKIKKEGEIRCKLISKSSKHLVDSIKLSSVGYFAHTPQLHQEIKQRFIFSYLTENKNVITLKLQNIRIRIISPNKTSEYYNDYDLDFLALTLLNSIINIRLKKSEADQLDRLGLVLGFSDVDNAILMNIPFVSQPAVESALFIELTTTTFHDFHIHKQLPLTKFEDPSSLPYCNIRMVGIGAKTLRRKTAKRK